MGLLGARQGRPEELDRHHLPGLDALGLEYPAHAPLPEEVPQPPRADDLSGLRSGLSLIDQHVAVGGADEPPVLEAALAGKAVAHGQERISQRTALGRWLQASGNPTSEIFRVPTSANVPGT